MNSILRILLALIVGALPAWAALGEYEGSVDLDQRILRGGVSAQTRAGYRFHEITTPEGAVIREYVSPEGRVFGVSWHAHFIPNLQQLLGSYFPRVEEAGGAKTQRGGPLVIRSEDFVYFSAGRMMDFRGVAYVPALLPQNVRAEVVR